MCCDCCLLGKAAQEQGLPCDHNLSVGYQCTVVSRACCADGASDKPTAATEQTESAWKKISNHALGNYFVCCTLDLCQRGNLHRHTEQHIHKQHKTDNYVKFKSQKIKQI